MNGWEILATIMTGLFATNGILLLIIREWYARDKLKSKQAHEKEMDILQHNQQMEAKESLSVTLNRLAFEKTFLNDIVENHNADYATILRMSNGQKWGDGVHKWKFSATLESIKGISRGIFNELRNKPIEEAGLLFTNVQKKGYCHVNILLDNPRTTLSNRLFKKGVVAYTVVGTDDLMKSVLMCWFEKKGVKLDGIDISEETLKEIAGDFQSMEDQLL